MTSATVLKASYNGSAKISGFLKRSWHATSRYRPVLILDVLLVVYFAAKYPVFTSGENVQNLLTSTAVLWILAMGMTFSMVSGGVDISVSAMVAFDGIFVAKITQAGVEQWLALAAVLVFGALVGGLVNGFFIGRLRLSFLIVTLASMTALTGVVDLWSGTNSVPVDSSFVVGLTASSLFGIQAPIWVMIVVFLVALYVQRFTYFGRDVYATGGSEQAARLSGINTTRTLVAVYAIVGLAAAIGSVVAVSQVGVASPTVDPNLPLEAIAATVLGGTALGGGVGGVGGTAFGVLFLGVLANGLDLASVPSFWQQVVTGVILLAAVLGNRSRSRRTRAWTRFSRRPGDRSGDVKAEESAVELSTPGAARDAESEHPRAFGVGSR